MYLAGSSPFEEFVAAASWLYDVPADWILAVIQTESSGNPRAYRAEPKINDASYGLMQLLYRTAKGLGYDGTPEGLYDPKTNIDLGTRLLRQLRDKYGEDFSRVYSAYNSGRPDLYLTSSDVWQHVQNALRNLALYAGTAKETVLEAGGRIETTVEENPLPAILAGLAFMAFWRSRRR